MSIAAAVLIFREGLEAALIVAILLGYLRKLGQGRRGVGVWAGVGLAVALTLGFAVTLQLVGAAFDYPAKGIYEGVTSLAAVAMLTGMIFWMTRQARRMKGSLERGVDAALAGGGTLALFGLAFLTVAREGLETGLFLSAATFASSGVDIVAGGLVGLAAAVAAAWLMYHVGVRLDLRTFFRVTSVLLVVFGAAILRYAVHEFEEVNLLPPLIERVWNTGGMLPDKTGVGAVLSALVGYTAKPSLLQLIAYGGYLLGVGAVALRLSRPRPVAATTAASAAQAQRA
ncbi:MAG TPA: FTR1 family protein [Thermomicrobiales bacterium]|nr:FTR1 family protein [Thermomicrobiales bacterium]